MNTPSNTSSPSKNRRIDRTLQLLIISICTQPQFSSQIKFSGSNLHKQWLLCELYVDQDSKAQPVALTAAFNNTIKSVHLHLIYYNTRILNINTN